VLPHDFHMECNKDEIRKKLWSMSATLINSKVVPIKHKICEITKLKLCFTCMISV